MAAQQGRTTSSSHCCTSFFGTGVHYTRGPCSRVDEVLGWWSGVAGDSVPGGRQRELFMGKRVASLCKSSWTE